MPSTAKLSSDNVLARMRNLIFFSSDRHASALERLYLWTVADATILEQRRRTRMPLVNVKCIEGVFTPAQKRELVERLTDAMVAVEGENLRPVTWVVIEEVGSGAWGIGGKSLTTEDVHALAKGNS
jgi:4-oxalocrotonate tautomerase